MKLHIVGSGCPNALAQQYGSAFVLEYKDEKLLIDCGPATTYKLARMGLEPHSIHQLFLTHHHYDHNVDFPCFALTRWDLMKGDEAPLVVYGPPPTASIIDRLFAPKTGAFFEDWQSRIEHRVSQHLHASRGGVLPRPAPSFSVTDVANATGETIATGADWQMRACRVTHVDPWLESLAFRFESEEGSIAFAGDCADCEALRTFAHGADTLVIACAYYGRMEYSEVITGHLDAAEVAKACDVRRVILTHMNPGFTIPGMKEKTIVEVSRIYGGDIYFPAELDSIVLPK